MDRFWSKVDKSGECWVWTGARFSRGYGMFSLDKRLQHAHRVAYQLEVGPIPAGMFVLHSCDNPPCVRPDHLRAGTHAENMAEMVLKRRVATGERQGLHRLHASDVVEIRRLAATGMATEAIGPLFGVSGRTVRYVVRGERWSHV